MKTKKILGIMAVTTLVATSAVFAEDGNVQMNAQVEFGANGQPPRPGMMGKMKEFRQEFREDRREAVGEFRDDMKARHEYMNGSGTPGMATPTPWKNLRENMKEARQDFKGDMKDIRGKMASITFANLSATQTAAISAKIGLTVDQIKAAIATGTPLRQIIGDKISREDMAQIMPMPMMASGTMMKDRPNNGYDLKPQKGFFNSLRMKFFGGGEENPRESMDASANAEVNVNAEANVNARPGIGNFFKRLFNW